MPRYMIRCEVWGGVTGRRSAPFRVNGKVQTFDSFEKADALARQMTHDRMSSPYRIANFRYTVGILRE